jgi:hypothetical protein
MSDQPVSASSSSPYSATNEPNRIVVMSTKNPGVAFALGFLFGPIGMLYATIGGALAMLCINVVIAIITLGFGLAISWPLCGLWAYFAAKKYNEQLMSGQRRY